MIGYKDQDSINFKITYGYKTLFSYMKESESRGVKQEILESQICIRINSGCFSYAEIPADYKLILGSKFLFFKNFIKVHYYINFFF